MAARAIGGMAYGFGKAVGALAEAVGNMLAPPPPLTPDQQERAERVAEERAEKNAARTAAVAKDEERVVAERARQPGVAPATPQEIHQQLLEQMARANAARDRDRDEDRGRERTR